MRKWFVLLCQNFHNRLIVNLHLEFAKLSPPKKKKKNLTKTKNEKRGKREKTVFSPLS